MNVSEFNQKYLMGRPRKDYGDSNLFGMDYVEPHVIPRIVCKDGFSVSLQASRTHYCHPRGNYGPWYEVELGFPTESDDRLTEYMDGNPETTEATSTVYGYVPLNLVLEIFEDHGGIDETKTKVWNEPRL